MCKGDFKSSNPIKQGDLVTYRTTKEIISHHYEKKIITNGVGIVINVTGGLAKVYWIYAQSYLWVWVDKLSTFDDLEDMRP